MSVWRRGLRVNELCLAGHQNTHLHSQVLGTASHCIHKQTRLTLWCTCLTLTHARAHKDRHTHISYTKLVL